MSINIENIRRFCKEDISKIENYDKAISDETQTWHCHHRLEIQGNIILSYKDLIKENLYYHRPACELIFLTHSEHNHLHNTNRSEKTRKRLSVVNTSKKLSEETKLKIKTNHSDYWKGRHHTEEAKEKNRLAHLGKKASEETRAKMREAHKRRNLNKEN